MAKSLEMVFRNNDGKEVVLSITDPKDNLTLEQVKPVMEDIVAKNIFSYKGSDLVKAVEARIRNKETTALA